MSYGNYGRSSGSYDPYGSAGWSQSQQRDYNFTTGQYAGGTYDSLSGTRRPTANELRAMILNRDSDSNATSAPAPAATSVASKPSVRDSLDQDFDILSRLAPPSTSVQSTKPTNSIDLGATGKPVPMGDVDFSQAGQMFLQMSNQLKEARAQSTKVQLMSPTTDNESSFSMMSDDESLSLSKSNISVVKPVDKPSGVPAPASVVAAPASTTTPATTLVRPGTAAKKAVLDISDDSDDSYSSISSQSNDDVVVAPKTSTTAVSNPVSTAKPVSAPSASTTSAPASVAPLTIPSATLPPAPIVPQQSSSAPSAPSAPTTSLTSSMLDAMHALIQPSGATAAVAPSTAQPAVQPVVQPVVQPSAQPVVQPSVQPSVQPAVQASIQPTVQPTVQTSVQPTVPAPAVVQAPVPSVAPSTSRVLAGDVLRKSAGAAALSGQQSNLRYSFDMRASDVGALKDLLKSATFRTDEKSVPLSPALQSLLHCSRVILSQSNTNAATEVSNLLQNAAAIFDFTIDSCLEHVSSASNAAKLNIGLQERDFAHQLHAFFTAKHNTARDIRLNMSLFLASLGRQMNGNLRLLWLARFCGLQLPDGLEHVSAHISSVNEAAKAFLALWHRCAYKLNSDMIALSTALALLQDSTFASFLSASERQACIASTQQECKSPAQQLSVDWFLDHLMQYWLLDYERSTAALEALFLCGGVHASGSIPFSVFRRLIPHLHPTLDESQQRLLFLDCLAQSRQFARLAMNHDELNSVLTHTIPSSPSPQTLALLMCHAHHISIIGFVAALRARGLSQLKPRVAAGESLVSVVRPTWLIMKPRLEQRGRELGSEGAMLLAACSEFERLLPVNDTQLISGDDWTELLLGFRFLMLLAQQLPVTLNDSNTTPLSCGDIVHSVLNQSVASPAAPPITAATAFLSLLEACAQLNAASDRLDTLTQQASASERDIVPLGAFAPSYQSHFGVTIPIRHCAVAWQEKSDKKSDKKSDAWFGGGTSFAQFAFDLSLLLQPPNVQGPEQLAGEQSRQLLQMVYQMFQQSNADASVQKGLCFALCAGLHPALSSSGGAFHYPAVFSDPSALNDATQPLWYQYKSGSADTRLNALPGSASLVYVFVTQWQRCLLPVFAHVRRQLAQGAQGDGLLFVSSGEQSARERQAGIWHLPSAIAQQAIQASTAWLSGVERAHLLSATQLKSSVTQNSAATIEWGLFVDALLSHFQRVFYRSTSYWMSALNHSSELSGEPAWSSMSAAAVSVKQLGDLCDAAAPRLIQNGSAHKVRLFQTALYLSPQNDTVNADSVLCALLLHGCFILPSEPIVAPAEPAVVVATSAPIPTPVPAPALPASTAPIVSSQTAAVPSTNPSVATESSSNKENTLAWLDNAKQPSDASIIDAVAQRLQQGNVSKFATALSGAQFLSDSEDDDSVLLPSSGTTTAKPTNPVEGKPADKAKASTEVKPSATKDSKPVVKSTNAPSVRSSLNLRSSSNGKPAAKEVPKESVKTTDSTKDAKPVAASKVTRPASAALRSSSNGPVKPVQSAVNKSTELKAKTTTSQPVKTQESKPAAVVAETKPKEPEQKVAVTPQEPVEKDAALSDAEKALKQAWIDQLGQQLRALQSGQISLESLSHTADSATNTTNSTNTTNVPLDGMVHASLAAAHAVAQRRRKASSEPSNTGDDTKWLTDAQREQRELNVIVAALQTSSLSTMSLFAEISQCFQTQGKQLSAVQQRLAEEKISKSSIESDAQRAHQEIFLLNAKLDELHAQQAAQLFVRPPPESFVTVGAQKSDAEKSDTQKSDAQKSDAQKSDAQKSDAPKVDNVRASQSMSLRELVTKSQSLPWLDGKIRKEIQDMEALIKGLNADNQRLVTELQREKASVASLERKTAAVCVQMEKQLAEVQEELQRSNKILFQQIPENSSERLSALAAPEISKLTNTCKQLTAERDDALAASNQLRTQLDELKLNLQQLESRHTQQLQQQQHAHALALTQQRQSQLLMPVVPSVPTKPVESVSTVAPLVPAISTTSQSITQPTKDHKVEPSTSSLQKAVADLTAQLAAKDAQMVQLRSKLKWYTETQEKLESDDQNKLKKFAEMQSRVSSLEKELLESKLAQSKPKTTVAAPSKTDKTAKTSEADKGVSIVMPVKAATTGEDSLLLSRIRRLESELEERDDVHLRAIRMLRQQHDRSQLAADELLNDLKTQCATLKEKLELAAKSQSISSGDTTTAAQHSALLARMRALVQASKHERRIWIEFVENLGIPLPAQLTKQQARVDALCDSDQPADSNETNTQQPSHSVSESSKRSIVMSSIPFPHPRVSPHDKEQTSTVSQPTQPSSRSVSPRASESALNVPPTPSRRPPTPTKTSKPAASGAATTSKDVDLRRSLTKSSNAPLASSTQPTQPTQTTHSSTQAHTQSNSQSTSHTNSQSTSQSTSHSWLQLPSGAKLTAQQYEALYDAYEHALSRVQELDKANVKIQSERDAFEHEVFQSKQRHQQHKLELEAADLKATASSSNTQHRHDLHVLKQQHQAALLAQHENFVAQLKAVTVQCQHKLNEVQKERAELEEQALVQKLDRERLARAEADCVRLQMELSAATESNTELRLKLAVSNNRPDTLAYNQLLAKVQRLEQKSAARENEFASVLQQMRVQHKAQHDYWQTRVAAFGAKSAPDAETLTALQQSNTELARTRQHNQQLETQIAQFQSALASKNSQLQTLQSEVSSLVAALQSLQR